MGFAHLHTHTEFSLLDGAVGIKKLIARVKALGMNSVAITDHGNMYGVVDFYREAKAEGIHPVIGCEVYVAPNSRFDKTKDDDKYHHLVLLCENEQGYKNLIKMVSAGFIEGFYYKPRIDFELLKEHSKGLIALSACLAGELPRAMLADDYEGAKEIAQKYIDLFGRENYFIEIQDHGIAEQKRINPQLVKLAEELGVGVVATNDIHYATRDDAKYQDVLMCIQMRRTVDEPDRMKFETDEFYIKSEEEMVRLFPYAPEAIDNTQKIAERCNVEFDFDTRHLPEYDVPDGKTAFEYLQELCRKGLYERYSNVTPELEERLNYELSVINKMGFVDYFLIVWDFINFAKTHDVMVGPGRGSAAGSIVSYTLRITDIDPIKYSLIFERFLNPERVSMPDIDIDFEPEGRQKVINYVIEKYGADCVAQIITFGTMKAKLAVRDVGRALNISYADTDRVAKLIPNELGITIDKALEISKELKALYENDEKVRELIDTSRAIEGLSRHSGTHAAGVVITKEPIVEYVPLQTNEDVITTQFVKDTIESLGLLKMDFLGLKNLTIIENAVKIIEKTRGIKIDINNLDYDIKEVYDNISTGNTDGVFQIESAGMKAFMQELKPGCLEDIIAGIALYRPGPMDSIPRYVYNKSHPDEVKYKHPLLEPILDVTYGCMVYQEQVMQIVRDMAGYSLGSADMLRRVISKKKADKMEIERKNFIYGRQNENGEWEIEGCINRGIEESVATDIFNEMSDFANYAFNKSHAAAYAYLTYQTAYLKTFYPVEFMASLISSADNTDKINGYLINCAELGINKLPPDINASEDSFTVENGSIRFGLSAVKNVGKGFVRAVVAEREENGKYRDFFDFVTRMADKELNKRAVEGLIMCGAFDSTGAKRSQLMQIFESVIDGEAKEKRSSIQGQLSLFDEQPQLDEDALTELPDIEEFDKKQLLNMEKASVGMYLSGHPMEEYQTISNKISGGINIGKIMAAGDKDEEGNPVSSEITDGQRVKIAGIITARKDKTTKSNRRMTFLRLEDLYGGIEVLVFPKIYDVLSPILREEEMIVAVCNVSLREEEEPKLLLEEAQLLKEYISDNSSATTNKGHKNYEGKKLFIKMGTQNKNVTEKTLSILKKHSGETPVVLYIADTKKRLCVPESYFVNPTEELLAEIVPVFGEDNVKLY
ncbi:MAG: DNA polymerase III subunit alpha [Eubacteriales bacterium]|nr:DNA polymerase III subunit alpha [Eubacteriales bacterium]